MTKLFGTNGIRGVINEDMNSELALGIGLAWGTYLKKTAFKPQVAIGTDARISSYMIKSAIISGLLSSGCDVVDIGRIPTPTLQYMVKTRNYDSGVIITASHNPPQFNGIKGTSNNGTEFSKNIEEEIEKIYFKKDYSFADWKNVGTVKIMKKEEAVDSYIDGIISNVNVDIIKEKNFNVILDCGNGIGGDVTPQLLERLGCKITKLYCEPNGMFPGRNSEPTPENITDLIKKVIDKNADFGVAQDGDADRAIFIDEKGKYIWGDKTLSLAAKYITKQRNGGITVTPVTTSSCLDDIVIQNGGKVIHTKVGSPIVASVMIENNAIFGGEENGGLIFPEMQYCRDSAMTIAKIMEIMANENKSLSELIGEIPNYYMVKTKTHCPENKKNIVMNEIINQTKNDKKVKKIDKTDGVKLFFEDGWILMRPSGTEPMFRIYSESKNKEEAINLSIIYKKIIEDIIN